MLALRCQCPERFVIKSEKIQAETLFAISVLAEASNSTLVTWKRPLSTAQYNAVFPS